KAAAVPPVATLGNSRDVFFPAPGLALELDRTFLQSLSRRYQLGVLGRGWTHTWEMSATSDAEGNVILNMGGGQRSFLLQSDGSYRGEPGDTAVLTRPSGAYQLRQTDGTVLAFRADGLFDYFEDRNGNRITAGYTGTLMTSLSHSDGDALSLSYNA